MRCPEGYGKECFYQKHLSSGVPDVIGRVEIPEKSGSETYLVIDNLAGDTHASGGHRLSAGVSYAY